MHENKCARRRARTDKQTAAQWLRKSQRHNREAKTAELTNSRSLPDGKLLESRKLASDVSWQDTKTKLFLGSGVTRRPPELSPKLSTPTQKTFLYSISMPHVVPNMHDCSLRPFVNLRFPTTILTTQRYFEYVFV